MPKKPSEIAALRAQPGVLDAIRKRIQEDRQTYAPTQIGARRDYVNRTSQVYPPELLQGYDPEKGTK